MTKNFEQKNKKPQTDLKDLLNPEPVVYFEDHQTKKIINRELLGIKAQKFADQFVSERSKLSSSQLRKFYDEIKAIERSILRESKKEEAFNKRQPSLLLLKAKAVYSFKRNGSPKSFLKFIVDHIESIKDVHDFMAFVKVFEAVVAYHKFFSKE